MECRRVVLVVMVDVVPELGRDGADDVVDTLVCCWCCSKGLFCGNLAPRRKEDKT